MGWPRGSAVCWWSGPVAWEWIGSGEAKSIDEGEKKKMRRRKEESREAKERKRKKEKIFFK